MTIIHRFRITTPAGVFVRGAVKGIGGMLAGRDAFERLCAASVRAVTGRPLRDVYEPSPGFCEVYPEYSAASDGNAVIVDLRNARIERVRST